MWPVRPVDEAGAARLAADAGLGPTLARVLWLRGVRDAEGARRWLEPTVGDLHPPELLPDFAPAVERLGRAIDNREKVLVWGHDDLDGVTAAVVMRRVISDLRGQATSYIPVKGKEPHGLSIDSALRLIGHGVGLIVTVDCGVSNQRAIAELKARGVDVLVTDHHELPDGLPPGAAVVDPKRPDSRYPYRGLAGVGVALKLVMGLCRQRVGIGPDEFLSVQRELLALAVLGTLADRVPITGENRTLVAVGLRALEQSRNAAVRAVFDRIGTPGQLTIARFVAELLPLFAAAGGNEGVEMLLSASPQQARTWVASLTERSAAWRAEAEATHQVARGLAVAGDGVVFARGRDLSLRALGFCAARLKDEFQLPAVVMGWRGDNWVGECRGIDGVDLMELLRAMSRFFVDFGGHRRAAGFSVADDRVEEFVRAAEQFAHECFAGRIEPENVVKADAVLRLADFPQDLRRLALFGEGSRQPLLLDPCVRLVPAGDGWSPEGRPDLVLRSQRPNHAYVNLRDEGGTAVLYTFAESGEPLLVDGVAGAAG
jgi:single-stranded-DNA-specific exonuclease